MRLTQISMFSNDIEIITFSLVTENPSSQYIVRNIAGLDAEEIIPRFYGFGLQSGNRFYDFSLKARDIVMRIVLNPRFRIDESYSEIRDYLYKAISSNRVGLITLYMYSGATVVAQIQGFIMKFEAVYFTDLPEVQMTIRCDDPMFRAINAVKFDPEELGTLQSVLIPDSLSTAPHGFTMGVKCKVASDQYSIQNAPVAPEWRFNVLPDGGFLVGDELYLSSEYNNRYVYLVRAGEPLYLMDKIELNSIWPMIFPGATQFYFGERAAFDWLGLAYNAAYWGV